MAIFPNAVKNILPILGWVILGSVLLFSLGIDLLHTTQSGAVDFRNRITGARLLAHGIDAYHYKWHEGDPPEYCDLRNIIPSLPVSKTTVTPAVLVLELPPAALPYRTAQFVWLFGQWILLLGIGWLWMRECPGAQLRWLIALFLTSFTFTVPWRWHAERGQEYIVPAFLFACWLMATLDAKRSRDFLAGFIAGFLVALRPPFALLLPFIALHRRRQWPGVMSGVLIGFGLPLLFRPGIWGDYFSAMRTYSDVYREGLSPQRVALPYPPTIEGVPSDVLGHMYPFRSGDFSVHGLLLWLGLEPVPAGPLLVLVGAIFLFWLWLWREKPLKELLPGLAAWFFIVDLFLPAFRYDYHDVFILNVVFAGIVAANRFPWAAWPCALALPISWTLYVFQPTDRWVINLPAFFFTVGAIVALFPGATNFRSGAGDFRNR